MSEKRYVMVGWFGIRHNFPLLFTESQEQVDEWERAGLLVIGAFKEVGDA